MDKSQVCAEPQDGDRRCSLGYRGRYGPSNQCAVCKMFNTTTIGSGIGLDCAIALAAAGARNVAFADINLTAAQNAAYGSNAKATNPAYRAIAVQVDVSSEESVQNMVEKVRDEFGRIDYSVNSAGVSAPDVLAATIFSIPDAYHRLESKLPNQFPKQTWQSLTDSTRSTSKGPCCACVQLAKS